MFKLVTIEGTYYHEDKNVLEKYALIAPEDVLAFSEITNPQEIERIKELAKELKDWYIWEN